MLTQLLTYFLLFGLMLLILPNTFSPFEVPKVIFTITSIVLLFLLSFPKLITKPIRKSFYLKCGIFTILTILAIYQLIVSIFPDNLIWGNSFRPQGTLVYLSLFLLFLIAHKLPFNLSFASKITSVILPILLIFTVIIGPRASFRFIGPLGEANALGAAVLFLFPFTSIIKNNKLKILGIFSAVALILMTGSRIALLAFAVEVLIIFFRKFRLIFLPGITAVVLVFIFSIMLPFLPHQVPENYQLRFENRTEIWTVSFLAGFDLPVLGSGFGSIDDAIKQKARQINNFVKYQPVDSTHNLFLNWWIMAGLVGVIILFSLISISLKNLYQQKNWILFSILIGLLMIQLFNPVSIITLVHFWWLLGLATPSKAWEGEK